MSAAPSRHGPRYRSASTPRCVPLESVAQRFGSPALLHDWLQDVVLEFVNTRSRETAIQGVAFCDAVLAQFADDDSLVAAVSQDRVYILLQAGLDEVAEAAAAAIIEQFPQRGAGYTALADLLSELGDADGAIEVLRRALSEVDDVECRDAGVLDRLQWLERNTDEIDWSAAVEGFPTDDPLDEFKELAERRDVAAGEMVDIFVHLLSSKTYHTWEAIIRKEQGLSLTTGQQALIRGLLSFSEDDEGPILYLDGLARPAHPWYETLQFIAAKFVRQPSEMESFEVEEWDELCEAVATFGRGLSVPPGIDDPMDTVSPDIRRRIAMQCCVEPLIGAGRWGNLGLSDPYSEWRIEALVEELERSGDIVRHFELTPATVNRFVEISPADAEFLAAELVRRLSMPGVDAPIADHLGSRPSAPEPEMGE